MSILLKGEKSLKHVAAWGYDRDMLVQPGVATTEYEMGIYVDLFEVDAPNVAVETEFWGLVIPHNLIGCWRGMLILQEVAMLEGFDLCYAYYAAQREIHQSDQQKVDEICAKITQEKYDGIMKLPIPEEVISLFTQLPDESIKLALWPITEEVKAGTLQWREEFERIGAKNPEQLERRKAAEKLVIDRYESYLKIYAREQKLPRHCWAMNGIEAGIINAVERGLERIFGPDVVFGIAIAREHAGTSAFVAFMGMANEEDFKAEEVRGSEKAARWVASHFGKGTWMFKKPLRSVENYQDLFQSLNAAWPAMPLSDPLTPEVR